MDKKEGSSKNFKREDITNPDGIYEIAYDMNKRLGRVEGWIKGVTVVVGVSIPIISIFLAYLLRLVA